MIDLNKFKTLEEFDKMIQEEKDKFDLQIDFDGEKDNIFQIGVWDIRAELKRIIESKKPKKKEKK